MRRETTVRRAVLVGRIVVNGPVFLLLFGPGALMLSWMPTAGLWVLAGFVVGFILAWLWWSLSVPRWRVWAYERVRDIAELKDAAVSAGLTWPDGHPFERTEIKSVKILERERQLESRSR
jgi:hypothetical protein